VSGRPYCVHTGEPDHLRHFTVAGSSVPYHTVINRHVFETLANNARIALHVRVLYGRDPHHITEAQYKAVARALRQAVEADPRVSGVPSTKGTLGKPNPSWFWTMAPAICARRSARCSAWAPRWT